MRRESGISKVLVLAPTSLKYQWKSEIEKFTDRKANVVEGMATVRHRIHRESNTDFQIASYHSALYDYQAMQEGAYDLLILDEAQRIKNWRTKIAQSVRRIKTRYVLVLTGTPVENNLEELYGLVQFVDPFALGPRHQFFPRYQTTDDNGRVIGYENLGEIRHLLAQRLIRRTKKQVLTQLPKRIDKNLVVPMTQPQKEMHREFADQVAKLVAKWQRMKFLDEQDRQKLLKNLNMMRMVCDSTYIIDQSTNYQTKLDELQNILTEIMEIDGEKAVVFSQWARMTDLVAKALTDMGVEFRYLHGGVPSKDRGALYTDFQNDSNVRVFLSTDAGGVGLNLQAAAWVINMDIPWNPGTLEQRIGRIYRMGQNKPVNIINLIAQSTIEHNLVGVLQFKKSMAAGVLDDGDDVIFMGDSKFKQFMASVETITRDIHTSEEAIAAEPAEPLAAAHETDDIESDSLPNVAPVPDISVIPEEALNPPLHESENKREKAQHQDADSSTPPAPETLLRNGIQFFNQLTNTLKDPQATQQLVQTIVHKDEYSGQTYLRVPVENEQVVEQVIHALGGLLKLFGGGVAGKPDQKD